VNPAATRTSTYRWTGAIPYTPNPADLTSVSGGGTGTRALDMNLKPEGMDEYTAGVDLGFTRDLTVRFTVVRKFDWGGSKELDLALPFEAFTDFRTGIDPGRDNTIGTSDDGTVDVWSVPRTYPTFGQINRFTTNTEPNEGEDKYWAIESTVSKRLSGGWSFLGSYTWDRRDVVNNTPLNPNQARYNWQLPESNQGVRLSGTLDLPWDFMFASTFTAQEGAYYSRVVQVRDALNTLVNVTVEGQAGRYDWVNLLDVRLSKTFRFGGTHSLEGMFDLFNVTNTSVVLRRVTTNGPNFMQPLATGGIDAASANPIPAPRIFRLSVRYRF
jgi:hypothetical protein